MSNPIPRIEGLPSSVRSKKAEKTIKEAMALVANLTAEMGELLTEEELAPFRTDSAKTVAHLGCILIQIKVDQEESAEPEATPVPVSVPPPPHYPEAVKEDIEFDPFDLSTIDALNEVAEEAAIEEAAEKEGALEEIPEKEPEIEAKKPTPKEKTEVNVTPKEDILATLFPDVDAMISDLEKKEA